MQLDNCVAFGRPLSGKFIIQVMTEFVVSYHSILGEQYQNYFESKTIRLFL